jgi:hypothetical protein
MGLFNKRSKREIAIEAIAGKTNMNFLNKDEYGLINYFKDFKVCRNGASHSIRNLTVSKGDPIEGQHGFFDYRYVIYAGNTTIIMDQTVFFIIDKQVMIPNFYLFPEAWHHKISKWFGSQDINLARYPEFSKSYMLQSEDEEFTRKLFDNEELILYFEDHEGGSFEATGYYLIMYKPGKLREVDAIEEMVDSGLWLNEILRKRSISLYK